jgi:hypothetical protein
LVRPEGSRLYTGRLPPRPVIDFSGLSLQPGEISRGGCHNRDLFCFLKII